VLNPKAIAIKTPLIQDQNLQSFSIEEIGRNASDTLGRTKTQKSMHHSISP
jgi:hypothetical protein